MRPVLTPAEMAAADRRTIEAGTPEAVLVERAGRAVAWAARRALGGTYGRRVLAVCGPGNNGADGTVAARVLAGWGARVDRFDLAGGVDRAAFTRALERADAVVDAMFGTGLRRALDGDAAWAAQQANLAGRLVIAVDVPSGVDGLTGLVAGDAAFRAGVTVCFAALKPGLLFEPGRGLAGTVEVVDIGVDPVGCAGAAPVGAVEPRDLRLPSRDPRQHKWSAGLLVVGGSTGMLGAPLLVSRAAARAGAGMVVCALPGRDAAAAASGSEIVTRALPATPDGALDADAARLVLRDLGRFHALAVGPGLGRDDRTQDAVRRLVAEAAVPMVVDADGLHALAGRPEPLRVRHAAGFPPAVLTPHAGEYGHLAGEAVGDDRVAAARHLAARTHAVVLLKGPGTVVADPGGRVAIDPTGSPALATAGSGDVLTGVIGGLLAAGVPPFEAALSGAFVQGAAARTAGTGDALVASDLLAALPRTLEALRTPPAVPGGSRHPEPPVPPDTEA